MHHLNISILNTQKFMVKKLFRIVENPGPNRGQETLRQIPIPRCTSPRQCTFSATGCEI